MFQLIHERLATLKINAAARWNIPERDCHIGHLILQSLLQEPKLISQATIKISWNQSTSPLAVHLVTNARMAVAPNNAENAGPNPKIDAATGEKETNESVAKRTIQLASAMSKFGLQVGDKVLIMGNNHLDLCIPFFACHLNGYSMCAVEPTGAADLANLWPFIQPNIIFCQEHCVEKVKGAMQINAANCELVVFDDEETDLKAFVKKHGGEDNNFRPAMFDPLTTTGWLMLTSGTTGLAKVAIVPFDTVLNVVDCWWEPTKHPVDICWASGTLQWMSGLVFFVSCPLRSYTRVQSSAPPSPEAFVGVVNKYKPCVTAWTPYLLNKFIDGAKDVCDISCFKIVLIGGSAIDKSLLDKVKTVCPKAEIRLLYGMTELLVPVFVFSPDIPFGSSGKPMDKYEYKLVDTNSADDGQVLKNPNEIGELWIKSNTMFKGYMNNPEETKQILKEDGWFATGDMFYRDEKDYYYFVERRRLLIKHHHNHISPLLMEEVLKRHPGVIEACVVNLPMIEYLELPVAAIQKKNDVNVDFQELFDLLDKNIAVGKKLSTGFFFIDSFPVTPSHKVHRAKLKELVETTSYTIIHRKDQ